MIRVLRWASFAVPVASKTKMLHALQKYAIIREETAKGDIQSRIKRFLAEQAVDGLWPGRLREYRYKLHAFARHVNRYPGRIRQGK